MLQTLKPNNNLYNGTVFELQNNNDFVQKVYLNDISIDTFIKNIDETNNYIAFIRRVSISAQQKNNYWFNNGPSTEYHLCVLRIPPGFYNTIENCVDAINQMYIQATSGLFNSDTSDSYYRQPQDYLLKIEDGNIIFNPNIYCFPVFFDKIIYTDTTKFDSNLQDIFQESKLIQNILMLTTNVQNFGTTNIYNYLLQYYSEVNSISGPIDFSLSTSDIFTKLGVHRYKLEFNQDNIAFNNNKPVYLVKGSNYCEYLFVGSVYDIIDSVTIEYDNIETTIYNYNNPIEISIITRPYPIEDYQNTINSETLYNMQTNVDIMSIANVNINDITMSITGINWADIMDSVHEINIVNCPYSYFYKTDDITYLDIYGTGMDDVRFQIFKQYTKHRFNYTISGVFDFSYAPIDNDVIQYNLPGIGSNKYNMQSGFTLTDLPPSIINNTINVNTFYSSTYSQELYNSNTIEFVCNNGNASSADPFSTQVFVTDINNYTQTIIKYLYTDNNLILSIIIDNGYITIKTIEDDDSSVNSDLMIEIQEGIMVDITFCDPYLVVTSTYTNAEGVVVFNSYGILRASPVPNIVIELVEDSTDFPKYKATTNKFTLNNVIPKEIKHQNNTFTYKLYNYFNASIMKFKQNCVANLHPSDKLFVYYSFDKNIDTILNNTSLTSEQIFSLLATIDMESMLKPYAKYQNNTLTYENPVHHILQNIDKTIELLPYTTLYIYITSDDLRYPLFKSDYVLSFEIL